MARSSLQTADSNLYKAYNAYLNSAHGYSPLLAGIYALSDAVSESQRPLTTSSESLALVATLSEELQSCLTVPESLAVAAGTDALQKLLLTTLARPTSNAQPAPNSESSAATTKKGITEAADAYVKQTLEARNRIASYGSRVIVSGASVIVPSHSRIVDDLLKNAAEAQIDFQVFFVRDTSATATETELRANLIQQLRNHHIGVTEITIDDVSQLCRQEPPTLGNTATRFTSAGISILAGASSILSSGGAIASSNTQSTIAIGRSSHKPVIIAAELAKIGKELGISASLTKAPQSINVKSQGSATEDSIPTHNRIGKSILVPAASITTFITEDGPLNPTVIAEEALRKWS